jgi:hypothetical protein
MTVDDVAVAVAVNDHDHDHDYDYDYDHDDDDDPPGSILTLHGERSHSPCKRELDLGT